VQHLLSDHGQIAQRRHLKEKYKNASFEASENKNDTKMPLINACMFAIMKYPVLQDAK